MKAFEMLLGVSFSGIANGVAVVYIIRRFIFLLGREWKAFVLGVEKWYFFPTKE